MVVKELSRGLKDQASDTRVQLGFRDYRGRFSFPQELPESELCFQHPLPANLRRPHQQRGFRGMPAICNLSFQSPMDASRSIWFCLPVYRLLMNPCKGSGRKPGFFVQVKIRRIPE